MRLLTNSAMAAFRRCQREYAWRYVECLRTLDVPPALSFGSAIHSALERWILGDPVYLDAIQSIDDLYQRARASVMLRAHDTRWESWDAPRTEVVFQTPLVNPDTGFESKTFVLAGKVDAVVNIDGEDWLVEHKTTSEDIGPGSVYWQRLAIDSQVSTYYTAFPNVRGVIYNVLRKPRHKPALATPLDQRKYTKNGTLYASQRAIDETPDEYEARLVEAIAADPDSYLQRGEVVRLADEQRDAMADAWSVGKAIRECEHANRWTRNADACVRYGRLCDYFGLCTRTQSRDSFRVATTPNEELV